MDIRPYMAKFRLSIQIMNTPQLPIQTDNICIHKFVSHSPIYSNAVKRISFQNGWSANFLLNTVCTVRLDKMSVGLKYVCDEIKLSFFVSQFGSLLCRVSHTHECLGLLSGLALDLSNNIVRKNICQVKRCEFLIADSKGLKLLFKTIQTAFFWSLNALKIMSVVL